MPEKLTDEQVAADFARLTSPEQRPGVTPEVAELLAKYKSEADHYKAHGPYVPQPNPVPVSEPMPGWAKGVALAAPTLGGGIWVASEGITGAMNAASPELAVCLAIGGLVVAALGRSAAKRGPRKVVTNNDYRGATITTRNSSGFTFKSNNG